MTEATRSKTPTPSVRMMLVPLALAQFICSFAGSNMNVMINDISIDLHTTVQGVQVCITLFLLVMAALMIPCGKLTDRLGRKRCFTARTDHLWRRRGPERGLSWDWRTHFGQFDLRGRRDRLADPARLHPHHHALYGLEVARVGFRGDQCPGWDRRRYGSLDRWCDHHDHHMASGLHLSGACHRDHRGTRPSPGGSLAARSDPSVRCDRSRPLRVWTRDPRRWDPGGRPEHRR